MIEDVLTKLSKPIKIPIFENTFVLNKDNKTYDIPDDNKNFINLDGLSNENYIRNTKNLTIPDIHHIDNIDNKQLIIDYNIGKYIKKYNETIDSEFKFNHSYKDIQALFTDDLYKTQDTGYRKIDYIYSLKYNDTVKDKEIDHYDRLDEISDSGFAKYPHLTLASEMTFNTTGKYEPCPYLTVIGTEDSGNDIDFNVFLIVRDIPVPFDKQRIAYKYWILRYPEWVMNDRDIISSIDCMYFDKTPANVKIFRSLDYFGNKTITNSDSKEYLGTCNAIFERNTTLKSMTKSA